MTRTNEQFWRTTLVCDECQRRTVYESDGRTDDNRPEGWVLMHHPTNWDHGGLVFCSKACAHAYTGRAIDEAVR